MTVWLPSSYKEIVDFIPFFRVCSIFLSTGLSQRVKLCVVTMNQGFKINGKCFHIEGFLKASFLCFLLVFSSIHSPKILYANNVTIVNAALVEQDQSADTIKVQFDLEWNNAWSDSVNNDAVWVFVKYCTSSCTSPATWSHATMKTAGTNPSGTSGGTKGTSAFNSLNIIVPSDKRGAFIQPAHVISGSGTVSFTSLKLVWDYAADGVSDATASNSTIAVRVFAIEMVYIPEGGFIAGDPTSAAAAGFEAGDGTLDILPAVSSEAGISFRGSSGSSLTWYYNTDSNANDDASGTSFDLSESFPKGFQAFYLMKYEITQGLYAAFLNTLTSAQDSARYPSFNGTSRYTISSGAASRAASRANRACNFLSWRDLAAFADWAGLRPMTELEFEKAARGPLTPVDQEFSWGDNTINAAAAGEIDTDDNGSAEAGAETGVETITDLNANVTFGNVTWTTGDLSVGPLRAGIFAESATTTRASTGAGYYGNMELSGNVAEMVVHLGNATGRGYSGTHGDGTLDSSGNATNPDWPGFTAGSGVNGAAGSGKRGGSWADTTSARLFVSDRDDAADEVSTRVNDRGGRAARTAP